PAAAATPAPAALDEVRLGLIAPLGGYWAMYAADALDFFTREGIKNDLTYTRSPSQSAQLLASGDLDVASNTSDTAIIAMSKGADFALIAGAQSDALFTLVSSPSVQTVPELRGKGIAINNSTRDGIASMVRRTLQHYGLRDDDVDLIMVGGTPERYTA